MGSAEKVQEMSALWGFLKNIVHFTTLLKDRLIFLAVYILTYLIIKSSEKIQGESEFM